MSEVDTDVYAEVNEISKENFHLQENKPQVLQGMIQIIEVLRAIAQSKTRNQNRLCVLALASLVILLIFVVFTCLAVAFVEISNLKSEIAHLPSGPAVHGVVYTRWGKSTCRSEVNRVYAGRTGSSFYLYQGGGANYICMPNDPEYSSYIPEVRGYNFVYGTE